MASCKGCLECLLKFFNFLLTLVGLSMIGYGIYLFVEYKRFSPDQDDQDISPSGGGYNHDLLQLGRPMLLAVTLSESILDKLPKAWFIYLFFGIGVVLVFISCFGCIGAATTNGCCLSCYSLLLVLLILAELGCAAFIFFDKSWKDAIPTDKTGNFEMIYNFLDDNWKIAKWVALGAVILEALVFLLALIVRSANSPPEYDSDEEYLSSRNQARQPLLPNRQVPPATGVPAAGALDSRPSRNDAWSARMREKYGLDTSEFTYNPTEPNRYPQPAAQPTEEKKWCTIM